MYEKLLAHVQKNGYFKNHRQVLIAVSGGVDSMNLLHFLHNYREKLEINLGVAHVNHGQRAEAAVEAEYLATWAKEKGLAFYQANFSGPFTEERARNFRYDFFKKVMAKESYTALVTAHHADDQVETVFMRLLRGSRLRYLRGIQPVQKFGQGELIRPLLAFAKKDLPEVFHFEDSSNQSLTYFRNRVRQQYLPLLEQENQQIRKHLVDVSHETSLLFEALASLTQKIEMGNCQAFRQESPAVRYFLLQEYLQQFPDLALSKSQFNQLLAQLSSTKTYDHYLKNGYYFSKTVDRFKISRPSLPNVKHQPILLPYQGHVRFGQFNLQWSPDQAILDGLVVTSRSPIQLRQRQAGDVLDFGTYHKKLGRWFIDEKISKDEREKAIVGEQDGKIIFVFTKDRTYLRKSSKNDIIEGIIFIEKIEDGGTC
ncbi:tRNA lysidine(34) synthetase TilS [Streptococcus cuniculipharyngis]|uniref:tRNA(Ile)-lysidine synthase n=1 Tax=Streptococcus cuniculipharyngis TaxID=1562651 RepID=A0A5C5SAJ4_9STRE|nr:tRNA lysidine(34) synthetase TilS [Streptococcus cuniculipharyngis]